MKKINLYVVFTSITLLFLVIGCKKNKTPVYDANSIDLTIENSNSTELTTSTKKWHITNKRICVIFGYDFNSTEQTTNLLSVLEENFGLDSEDGLIYPLIYPNDFKHGVKGYATDLTNLLDNTHELIGIVIIGAPENTHSALARNQDKWGREIPYPVIALFPQDDVLGIESTCDIVIDKGQAAQINGDIGEEETEAQMITEAPAILIDTIKYISNLSYALPKDSSVQAHVTKMLGGRSFHYYTDPETGLKSINHFVLD